MVRIWAKSVCVLFISVGIFSGTAVCAAEAPQKVIDQHESAVTQARDGDIPGGLKKLDALIDSQPDFYPAKRDYVIIATWADDCDTALLRFNVIRNESPLEGYLVEPVAGCLRDLRQYNQAIALLESSLAKNPDDEDAKRALADLKEYIYLQSRPTIDASVGFNESDQGNKEWQAELKYTQEITASIRGYYRHLILQADDPQFATGDVSRAGLGVLAWFGIQYLLDVEVFTDVDTEEQEGGRINLSYYPNRLWEFSIDHTSAAEDTPLRARADPNPIPGPNFVPIKAVRTLLSSSYHSKDYRWEWSANYGEYHFSDTNKRQAVGTSIGYAYQLEPKQEQRLTFGLNGSQNEASDVNFDPFYYNPEEDWSATISLSAINVYDTSWERLSDNFTVFTGLYKQQGIVVGGPAERREIFGGARYEVSMDLSQKSSLGINMEYANRIYDGVSERQSSISISYSQKL